MESSGAGVLHRNHMWRAWLAAVVVVLITLGVTVPATPEAQAGVFVQAAQQVAVPEEAGDTNCDGRLGIVDAFKLLEVVVESAPGGDSCLAVDVVGANLGRGELTGDGLVTIADVLVITRCLAGFDLPLCPPAPAVDPNLGDVNCDGTRDQKDVNILAGIGSQLPVVVTGSLCDPNDDSVVDLERGDLTRNGEVSRGDALQLDRCLEIYDLPYRLRSVDVCPRNGNEVPALLGDVDCNGVVDADDALALQDFAVELREARYSCGNPSTQTLNVAHGDFDGDGDIDLRDGLKILECVEPSVFSNCPSTLAPPQPPLPTPDYDSPFFGDVSCNGRFDIIDAREADWLVATGIDDALGCDQNEFNPRDASRGDLDRDGRLTYDDVALLQDCSVGLDLGEWPCPATAISVPAVDSASAAMGDVNCDGVRTQADADAIGQVIDGTGGQVETCANVERDRFNIGRADLNGDRLLTAADKTLLEQCLANPTADGCPAISCGAAGADPVACTHEQRVLSVRFLPRDPDAPDKLDPWALSAREVDSGAQYEIDDLLDDIDQSESAGVTVMANATRYRGWANPDAVPSTTFNIVERLDFFERPPIGLPYFSTFRPDYQQILSRDDIDICEWVDNQGIDEVWMWSMHTERIEPVESNMSSRADIPFIDISNSEGTDDLPHCSRTYVLYNFNFTVGVANMLHNRGHHMESLLNTLPADRQTFLYGGYTGQGNRYEALAAPLGYYRCGNVHRSSNAPVKEAPGEPAEHNWLERVLPSDCPDWRLAGGTPTDVSCATWFEPLYGSPDCFDDTGMAWVTWWFQNLPGLGNDMIDDGRRWRNVFNAIGDPDAVLLTGSRLFETEELAPVDAGGAVLSGRRLFVRHGLPD